MNHHRKQVGIFLFLSVIFFIFGGMNANKKSKASSIDKEGITSNTIQSDSSEYAEGRRLAKMWGCYGGCHAGAVAGSQNMGPDLSGIIQNYSVSDLRKVLRDGKRPNGTEVISMPATMFRFIKDDQIGPILTFLKQVPAEGQ